MSYRNRPNETGRIWLGSQGYTVKRGFKTVATGTADSVLAAGVAGKKIRVLWVNVLIEGTAQTFTFKSKPAGASAAISPAYLIPAGGQLTLDENIHGYFETVAGEALTVTTAAGGSNAHFTYGYIEVT